MLAVRITQPPTPTLVIYFFGQQNGKLFKLNFFRQSETPQNDAVYDSIVMILLFFCIFYRFFLSASNYFSNFIPNYIL